mmetsp:Transcript_29201/g.64830  ORF Transcript_29201/g.64830 Transcript_29201/m.64830 type:complete len:220 (-) Transcript_29201:64-723(-)
MAPKRKSEGALAATPNEKKPKAKAATSTLKKRSRDESDAAPAKTPKSSKKAAKETVEEPTTASKSKKLTKTPQKAAPEEPTAPKSAAKSARKPRASSASAVSMPPLPVVEGTNITSESSSSEYLLASVEEEAEEEAVGIWTQAWNALFLCLVLIGPAMLSVILLCYVVGMSMQSQQVACVGVVYTLLFLVLMGLYGAAVLPCILLSRLFISVVASQASL